MCFSQSRNILTGFSNADWFTERLIGELICESLPESPKEKDKYWKHVIIGIAQSLPQPAYQ